MKHALIFGIGGQDGSYLATRLLSLGYHVTGTYRRSSVDNLWRIKDLIASPGIAKLILLECDLTDAGSVDRILSEYCCNSRKGYDEIYNLADQDHVGSSMNTPLFSVDVTYGGPARLFDAILREQHRYDHVKIFQPISATIFGDDHTHACNENTQFNPKSPYAVAKTGAYYLAQYYRQQWKMKIWTGILYGHSSIKQKPEYLVHKIAKQAVEVAHGRQQKIHFHDVSFQIDVGAAESFVRGYHQMIQQDTPDDYILSTGRGHSIKELVCHALNEAGAKGFPFEYDAGEGRTQRCVIGDCSKAKAAFNWETDWDAMDVVENLVDFYTQEHGKPK